MAIVYDEADSDYIQTLEHINLAFTLIFIIEFMLKVVGLGLKDYF